MNINIIVTGTAIVTITITVIVTKKGHVYTHSYSKDTDPVITTFKIFQRLFTITDTVKISETDKVKFLIIPKTQTQ